MPHAQGLETSTTFPCISRRQLEIATASIQCSHSLHEIFYRNNAKPQRTAHSTQALSHKVPTTAFKQKRVKDTEIKSNILLPDKACRATALTLIPDSCRCNPSGSFLQGALRGSARTLHLASHPQPIHLDAGRLLCHTPQRPGCLLWREGNDASWNSGPDPAGFPHVHLMAEVRLYGQGNCKSQYFIWSEIYLIWRFFQ